MLADVAFEVAHDLVFGAAFGGATGDVIAGAGVLTHADRGNGVVGSVEASIVASVEAVGWCCQIRPGAVMRRPGRRTQPPRALVNDDRVTPRAGGPRQAVCLLVKTRQHYSTTCTATINDVKTVLGATELREKLRV